MTRLKQAWLALCGKLEPPMSEIDLWISVFLAGVHSHGDVHRAHRDAQEAGAYYRQRLLSK